MDDACPATRLFNSPSRSKHGSVTLAQSSSTKQIANQVLQQMDTLKIQHLAAVWEQQ